MSKKVTGENSRKAAPKASSKKKVAGKAAKASSRTGKSDVRKTEKTVRTGSKKTVSKPSRRPAAVETSYASSTLSDAAPPSASEEDVRVLAHEISLKRSGPADPVADWFLAERELAEPVSHK